MSMKSSVFTYLFWNVNEEINTWHFLARLNLVFHDTHFCQIWSYTEQNKFYQKLPPVEFEPKTSSNALPTELSHYLVVCVIH